MIKTASAYSSYKKQPEKPLYVDGKLPPLLKEGGGAKSAMYHLVDDMFGGYKHSEQHYFELPEEKLPLSIFDDDNNAPYKKVRLTTFEKSRNFAILFFIWEIFQRDLLEDEGKSYSYYEQDEKSNRLHFCITSLKKSSKRSAQRRTFFAQDLTYCNISARVQGNQLLMDLFFS